MFSDFKAIAVVAVSAFKAIAGQQRREWMQMSKLFDDIAAVLTAMASKYDKREVPREEFVAVQMYAEELRQCWKNMPLSGGGDEVRKWSSVLDQAITTADGTDSAYFGFRSVPGPFYSRKEGYVARQDSNANDPPPSTIEIREAASVFRTAASILRSRGG